MRLLQRSEIPNQLQNLINTITFEICNLWNSYSNRYILIGNSNAFFNLPNLVSHPVDSLLEGGGGGGGVQPKGEDKEPQYVCTMWNKCRIWLELGVQLFVGFGERRNFIPFELLLFKVINFY